MNGSVATNVVPRPRITLKQMFAVVTAVALVLAPTYWFGGPYLVSAFFSICLVALCVRTYQSSRLGAILVAAVGAMVGLFLVIILMVFFFHAALTVVACLILCAIGVRTRTFAIALTLLMVAVYGYSFAQGAVASREIQMLKEKYPFESLRGRLAFESNNGSNADHPIDPIQLSPAVASNLKAQDDSERSGYYSRSGSLRELHEASYREFARAAGFGFMRMDSLRYRLIQPDEEFTFRLPAEIAIADQKNVDKSLAGSHAEAVDDFISPDRMGYVRSRDEVAGFESHRFRSVEQRWKSPFWQNADPQRWRVIRLELVGLLRNPEPRVYVAPQFPSMDKLSGVPHRALNEFEAAALEKLKTQQDVVVNQQPSRILMLGAVRAGTTCLECHEAPRGKLLGAFSYELVPITDTKTNESQPEIMKSL